MRCPLPRGQLTWGIVLFGLALGVRLLDLFGRDKFDVWGQCEVERAALTLATTGTMGDAFGPGTGPTAHVPPLYTLLLAGLHVAFGPGSHEAVVAQRVVSALAAALCIALLPLVARRAGLTVAVGVVSGFLVALSPCYFFVENYGKQESVFAALLGIGLFLSWMRLREVGWQSRRDVAFFACLTGLACLLAPQLGALVALALVYDFWSAKRAVFRAAVVTSVVSLVMIAPWAYRNYQALGGFVPLRSNFWLECTIGNNPVANGWTFAGSTTDSASTAWPHPYSNPREKARLREVGELVYMREKSVEAKTWIREHPRDFVRLSAQRVWLYWFTPDWIWSKALSVVPLRVAYTSGLTLLAFLGLLLLFRQGHPQRWPLLFVLVAPSLIYLVTHVNPRYRYGNLWTTALLAGYALVWAWQLIRSSSTAAPRPRPAALPAARCRPAPCESPLVGAHD